MEKNEILKNNGGEFIIYGVYDDLTIYGSVGFINLVKLDELVCLWNERFKGFSDVSVSLSFVINQAIEDAILSLKKNNL